MPTTERDLAEDAQWKVIQKNTFTRWVNERLKVTGVVVLDLETDLSNGLKLIELCQVLSGKKISKYNKAPNFRTQRLENVTVCLRFLEQGEKIRIVNIDSSDIVDSNLKLILGLIWTLILHYAISMSTLDDDSSSSNLKDGTPKQRLLAWIQSKIPDRRITNFTSDWNNGINIGALVDALASGLCPDWKSWTASRPVDNASAAMDSAEKWLNIPQVELSFNSFNTNYALGERTHTLIKPGEMCNPSVDEQSMMTYLSQFPNAKLHPEAPINTKTNPSRCKAYGPGLESGIREQVQKFTVDTKAAGPGVPSISIHGASDVAASSRPVSEGVYAVEYVPDKSGDYNITVKFANLNIPGSPFRVKIVDPVNSQLVRCSGAGLDPKGVRKGHPAIFIADASQAGSAVLEVFTVNDKGLKKASQVNPRGDGVFDVVYKPDAEGKCQVNVNYGGKPVKGSPFNIPVLSSHDSNRVIVSGEGVKPKGVKASLPVRFVIDTRDAGLADLDVIIQDPSGNFVRPKILDTGSGTYIVEYVPTDCGKYTIIVKYGGQHVPGSSFTVEVGPVGDASKVSILDPIPPIIPVGESSVINLRTTGAGDGTVSCSIRSNTGDEVEPEVTDRGSNLARVAYVPQKPGSYDLNIKFGGQTIPKGQFVQKAVDPAEYRRILYEQRQKPLHPVDFTLPTGSDFKLVSALITTPSGKKHQPKIEDNRDDTVKILYQPEEFGRHLLDVQYDKFPIQGSPFSFYVNEIDPDHVIAYGPGLSYGTSGKPCQFIIVTKEDTPGGLGLSIEGPSKAQIECIDNKNGTCSVTYLPTAPGEYSVAILFKDDNIAGSVFKPKILIPADEINRSRLTVGKLGDIPLWITDAELSNLTATIRNPSGQEEPCSLNRLENGYLGISFTPREVGEYLVSILRFGRHIPNSPFKIYVDEGDLGNASRVKVYGPGIDKGLVNELNEFFVNSKDAGFGGLSLSIEGPSKADINCEDDDEEGATRITYKPTEPGNYIVTIKFADQHVTGSPFLVHVSGKPGGRLSEKFIKQRDAPDATTVGSECELSLKVPDAKPYDLEATVANPSGSTDRCNVVERGEGLYTIKFIPSELGVHSVIVRHRKVAIPGSPFQFTVGPILDGGAHKVRAMGPGLEKGEVQRPCNFNVSTREAGVGSLALAIEGPSKAEINFKDQKDGSCEVSYICSEPGDYLVSIRFNDSDIPDSPYKVPIIPSIGRSKLLDLHGLQNQIIPVSKPASFSLDVLKSSGVVGAIIVAPSGAEEQAIIQQVETDRYSVRFIPRENGVHYIHVRHNGVHIKGSPFKLIVGEGPQKEGVVRAQGEGLQSGTTGSLCKFLVTTKDTGDAALAVTVDGPSKVELNCREVEQGYEFSYTPRASGYYLIHIKQAGNVHIAGSPFKATIKGHDLMNGLSDKSDVTVETVTKTSKTEIYAAPGPVKSGRSDASRVTASGAGLHKASVNKEATFIVDAGSAGSESLMVGLNGSKLPCEEVKVKHMGSSKYSVSYTVHDPDTYQLSVKWGDHHIPGSPFQVVAV